MDATSTGIPRVTPSALCSRPVTLKKTSTKTLTTHAHTLMYNICTVYVLNMYVRTIQLPDKGEASMCTQYSVCFPCTK